MSVARRRPNSVAEIRREMPAGVTRARRRRKPLRQHFREGLEAGLKAGPEAFAATKPRTMMGLMVRELLCAAANARCDAIRLVFDFVDEGELQEAEAAADAAGDNSQGNSQADSTADPKWDWDETGWDSSARIAKPGEADAERSARTEALREELFARCIRIRDADRENQERTARLAAGQPDQAPPDPSPAPFSGIIDPNSRGTIRIGGKIVEG